eukprot:2807005-Amphidinium_carterae.1
MLAAKNGRGGAGSKGLHHRLVVHIRMSIPNGGMDGMSKSEELVSLRRRCGPNTNPEGAHPLCGYGARDYRRSIRSTGEENHSKGNLSQRLSGRNSGRAISEAPEEARMNFCSFST